MPDQPLAPGARSAPGDPWTSTPLRRFTERAVDWLAIATFSAMFLCVFTGVLFRYFLGSPLTWSDELGRYLFVWCAMLGWVIAARRRSHLAIGSVQDRTPPRARAALKLLAALAAVAFAAILCYYGVWITVRNADVETPSLFFTIGVVYAIVPVAALAVGLHAIGDALAAIRDFVTPSEAAR
jgi:TRAP-type C4-dicarboxylate transport system permease small subunit